MVLQQTCVQTYEHQVGTSPTGFRFPYSTRNYYSENHKDIEGWMHECSAFLVVWLTRKQIDMGVTGSVGEICVHHGKFFLALATVASRQTICVQLTFSTRNLRFPTGRGMEMPKSSFPISKGSGWIRHPCTSKKHRPTTSHPDLLLRQWARPDVHGESRRR